MPKGIQQAWLFCGDNYQAEKIIKQKVTNIFKEKEEEWVTKIRANDLEDMRFLVEEIRTIPMFSDKKVIILQEIPNGFSDIMPIVHEIPETNFLFIYCDYIDKRSKVYKDFKNSGRVKLLDVPDVDKNKDEIKKWCKNYLKKYNFSISDMALSLFMDKMGGISKNNRAFSVNYNKIEHELEKIMLYKMDDDNKITKDEVDLLIEDYGERSIFLINDAINNGDAERAIFVFEQLILSQGKRYKKDSVSNSVLFNLLSMYKAIFCMNSFRSNGISTNNVVDAIEKILHSTVYDPPKFNDDGTIKTSYYSKPQLYAIRKNIDTYSLQQSYSALMLAYKYLDKTRETKCALNPEDLVMILIVNLCIISKSKKI
jgi:DNA polymerase III delta subunit